jgi:hypothetical protein
MHSIIISDYGVMLAKTGERLVIRGSIPGLLTSARRIFCYPARPRLAQ